MYIVAFAAPHRIREISHYLYKGQEITSSPKPGAFGTEYVIIQSADDRLTEDLVNRLSSGLIGAKAFEKFLDADNYGRNR